MSNSKGFSLIEIMVTVGIMGILLAISVPQYTRYLRNAKTIEAKNSLSEVYIAQKNFYIIWNFYMHDLILAGISPEGELLYNVGFSSSQTVTAPTSYTGTALNSGQNDFNSLCGPLIGKGTLPGCGFENKHKTTGFTPPTIPSSSSLTLTSFKAVAIADLKNHTPTAGSTGKDIWSINNYRQVAQEQDGTK